MTIGVSRGPRIRSQERLEGGKTCKKVYSLDFNKCPSVCGSLATGGKGDKAKPTRQGVSLCFETGSPWVALAGPELPIETRLASDSQGSTRFCLPSVMIKVVHHHTLKTWPFLPDFLIIKRENQLLLDGSYPSEWVWQSWRSDFQHWWPNKRWKRTGFSAFPVTERTKLDYDNLAGNHERWWSSELNSLLTYLVSILPSSMLEKNGTEIWLAPEIWSLEGCQSLMGLMQNSRSYLTFFKLIATKCRHAGLDSSCAKGYQDQPDHGQRPGERSGLRAGPQGEERPHALPTRTRLSPEGSASMDRNPGSAQEPK